MNQRLATSKGYDLFIAVLSVYVLAALAATSLCDLSAPVLIILDYADIAICVVFLADFIYRFRVAPDKWGFLKWGWIDLISSIPMLDMFRWGRAVRLVRIVRLLRVARSGKRLTEFAVAEACPERPSGRGAAFRHAAACVKCVDPGVRADRRCEHNQRRGRSLVGAGHNNHCGLWRQVSPDHRGPPARNLPHGLGHRAVRRALRFRCFVVHGAYREPSERGHRPRSGRSFRNCTANWTRP